MFGKPLLGTYCGC